MPRIDVSTETARLDRDLIYHYLTRHSHWARDMPRATLERALRHSLVFGAYHGTRQVGFARVITDHATFAYLSDVFILPEARGQGAGRALMSAVLAHPDLQELRRFLLVSRDARPFYARLGFVAPGDAERYMELRRPHMSARERAA